MYGVDVGGHHDFIEWFAENPAEAQIEFRASGTAEDVVNRTTATIGSWSLGGNEMGQARDHKLHFGLPTELEEAMAYTDVEDRYEAIETALAALTACINGTIGYNALRKGLEIEDVTTTVRIPVDLRVLFGIHGVDKAAEMYGDLEIDVEVTAPNLSDEEIEMVRGFPKRSPVYNLLTRAHPSTPNFTFQS
ncbi:OsmC family protein [Salinigranum halophilum]|uniref:OsmC family protein n=1 Tax=Salinigranum halophilum TaxID=2565931 RepID=UPI00191BF7BD|nr:OsmC family protein [Salinigranum halophilum]